MSNNNNNMQQLQLHNSIQNSQQTKKKSKKTGQKWGKQQATPGTNLPANRPTHPTSSLLTCQPIKFAIVQPINLIACERTNLPNYQLANQTANQANKRATEKLIYVYLRQESIVNEQIIATSEIEIKTISRRSFIALCLSFVVKFDLAFITSVPLTCNITGWPQTKVINEQPYHFESSKIWFWFLDI